MIFFSSIAVEVRGGALQCLHPTQPGANEAKRVPGSLPAPPHLRPHQWGAPGGPSPTSSPSSLRTQPWPRRRKDSLCDTLTSSVTFQTPEVTKQSWKLKCPEEGKGQVSKSRHSQEGLSACLSQSLPTLSLFHPMTHVPAPGWPSEALRSPWMWGMPP